MIEVRVGDLAEAAVDAIVRPVAADFSAVTSAMRRFEQAAGESVARQCRRMGEIPVGSAIITAAGALDAQLIIHVAVRSDTENATGAVVRQGFLNALRRAAEWDARSIAAAPLGTGAATLDAETAADIMLEVLAERVRAGDGPERVVLVVEDAYQEAAFANAVSRHLGERTGTNP